MEWGATSKGRAPVGNKKSKEETAADAAKILDGVLGPNFKFNPSVQSDTPTLQMTSAVITLARTPPSEYEKSAVIAESFVFVAAAALSRFEVPLAALAKTLLRDHRKELVEGLQKERTLEIDRFLIKARTGCLEVDLQSSTIRVYVKTPFAPSDKC